MTAHDQINIRIYENTVLIGNAAYNDNSAEFATMTLVSSNCGLTSVARDAVDVVTIKIKGQLTVGLGVTYATSYSFVEIIEVN